MSNTPDLRGLTQQEAARRLSDTGFNEVASKKESTWQILFRQFASPFIYLLALASAISLFLGETVEGLMITAFVLINAFIGFVQEQRSAHAVRELRKFISPTARVRRNGTQLEIAVRELVPGDILLLEAGDRIPADATVLEAHSFMVDESVLTGESQPVTKDKDSQPLVFTGTHVVMGRSEAIVTATGTKTRLGGIAGHVVEHRPPGEFEVGISRFSNLILRMVVITLVIVFLANVILKDGGANLVELLVFSIALAVSVIPEALPLVTSIALSRGALKLAKQKVVLKRLSAMENLGSIDVLCTDKTGTLTENSLTVHAVMGDHKEILTTALLGSRDYLSDGQRPKNAFDAALFDALTTEARPKNARVIDEIPFDPTRRRSTLAYGRDGVRAIVMRGAPETLFACCAKSDEPLRIKVASWSAAQGALGCRVLAVATKKLSKDTLTVQDESDLDFLGLIAFRDPVKSTATKAIQQAKKLGVEVKILTGDSQEVAAAVAREIGLINDDEVMLGDHFIALNETGRKQAARNIRVFARTSPEQKYEIIKYVRNNGKDVGFLGEGVNDVPALKIAEVGMVVQSASDVARESADIVLLESSLLAIVNGIKLGREVFANTNTYLRATLTSNFGNFYAIAISTLFIPELPMLPVQILLVNLLSDFPMISISSDRPDASELRKPKHYNVREIIIVAVMLGSVSTIFDFIFFALYAQAPAAILQTNWFMGSVLTELVLIFSIRTRGFFLKGKPPSFWLLAFTITAGAATIIIPYTQVGKSLFKFQAPNTTHLLTILGVVLAYFLTTEVVKLVSMKNLGQSRSIKT
jgi:Mg2+-importing ATPase